ncbi:hypothetical protein D3C80_1828110 [compost metagenome]
MLSYPTPIQCLYNAFAYICNMYKVLTTGRISHPATAQSMQDELPGTGLDIIGTDHKGRTDNHCGQALLLYLFLYVLQGHILTVDIT